MDDYDERRLREKFEVVLPALNERQQRLFLAAEAKCLGRGGVTAVARIAEVSRETIYKGLRELEYPGSITDADTRVRAAGGGRKAATEKEPELLGALQDLVSLETRGDPESPLLWTCKSCRQIADALRKQGFKVSHQLVGRLLNDLGYSLQANVKTEEGSSYEGRDEQFRHLAKRVTSFQADGQPAISVDTKKKSSSAISKTRAGTFSPKESRLRPTSTTFPAPRREEPFHTESTMLQKTLAGWVLERALIRQNLPLRRSSGGGCSLVKRLTQTRKSY